MRFRIGYLASATWSRTFLMSPFERLFACFPNMTTLPISIKQLC